VTRLFVAVDLDDRTRAEVSKISTELREKIAASSASRSRLSWVSPERFHLTLVFLGAVDSAIQARAVAAVGPPVREDPFQITFRGLGMFPVRGSPRVFWLGVTEGLEPLRRVHAEIGGRLGSAESASTADPFHPHLTLARFRDRLPRSALRPITEIPASAGPCLIDRVTLYESRLSSKGPTYIPISEARLTS